MTFAIALADAIALAISVDVTFDITFKVTMRHGRPYAVEQFTASYAFDLSVQVTGAASRQSFFQPPL